MTQHAHGGETHQLADNERPALTTQQGVVVGDDQNTLRAGERGPALLEDFAFREKLFHFDHERIPERVVHARGYGAHGFFENYEPLSQLTRADPFQEAGRRTPAFVRFSTVAGNKGSSDLARDVRGFAVKLYTREGNWDLVGNNIPVFFIQDAIKFPDIIHAAKEQPDRGFPQAQTAHDNFWDFVSLMPECTHMDIVAPTVGGVSTGNGGGLSADQKIGGGPSVLYDAIAVIVSERGAQALAEMPAARDFVTDAFAHSKFIAHSSEAQPLFAAAGLAKRLDAGFVPLADGDGAAADFVARCRELRFWR
jgi:hypothetical protein